MKMDTKTLYLKSLAISFPVCFLGAIISGVGKGVDSKLATAIGGIMTLPLTALLGLPCLAIVMLAPLALAAATINPGAGWVGKALAVAGLLAGAAWAILFATGLHGMITGINL